MRVALLSDCYPPRLGGIEAQVHDLAAHLAVAGHEVMVLTATGDHGPDSDGRSGGRRGSGGSPGVEVHRLALRLPGGIPVNPFAPPEVRRLLSERRVDVAHVHMGVVSPFATDAARVALSLGVPTAVTWHCVVERSAPLLRLVGHARRWSERGAALSAVSTMAAGRVQALLGVDTPVGVLGNGIDAAAWAPAAVAERRSEAAESVDAESDGDGVVGGVGVGHSDAGGPVRVVTALRLARRKRPLAALRVLRRVADLVGDAVPLEGLVAGEGPQRPLLERYLARHRMGWVRLLGRLPREELRRVHSASDIYLTPARLEAFGIAALEARTAGLPVVARAGTGIEDFVTDGVNGLLVPDDEGLAVAVARLALDAATRTRIAAHNRTTPPRQDWPGVVAATLAEYERAVARATGVGGRR